MTVEDRKANLVGENGEMDQFPIGMRVLAVDDDPICLKVLENLLRKCQYHVTTTNQAVQALKMLRENRNKFDLVISDVNMPDMDGFKLLELVGLEMDLPVIMLSAHSDTELVKKGVTHGACDYLLKPVRIEELKNIWQHVLRRKKPSAKNQNKCTSGNDTPCQTVEVAKGFPSAASADNGKPGKRRKDQDDDDEGGEEESTYENDDSSTQKKQRVLWLGELHRKFIAAVNHLGYEKAVPKKILDLMNVEGLTRENVASHLQKYRQYLKKMCTKEAQQCNMMAAFGGKDTSFRPMASLNGFSMTGTGRLSNATFSSYPSREIVGRLNSTAGLSLHGIASSGMIQQGTSHNMSSSLNILGKPHPALFLANQPPSIFNGISMSSDHIQLHRDNKHTTPFKESNLINDASSFTVSTSFPDARVAVGSSSNYDYGVSRHPWMLQGHKQQIHGSGEYGDQSSLKVSLNNPEPLESGTDVSNILGHGQSNKNCQLPKFSSNVSLTGIYPPDGMPAINLTISSAQPDYHNFPVGFPSTSVDSCSQLDLREETQCYEELIGSVVEAMNGRSKEQWEAAEQDYYANHSSIVRNCLVSGNSVANPLNQGADQKNAICLENIGSSFTNQLNNGAPTFIQPGAEISAEDTWMNYDGKILMDSTNLQNGFANSSFNSLDELVNVLSKQDQDQSIQINDEFGFDAQSLGSSCI